VTEVKLTSRTYIGIILTSENNNKQGTCTKQCPDMTVEINVFSVFTGIESVMMYM